MASIRTSCTFLMFTVLAFSTGCGGGKTAIPAPVLSPGASSIYAIARPPTSSATPSSIVEFPAAANGVTAPSASITVDLTPTEFLDDVAVDIPGNIYVTTHNAENQPSGPYAASVRIYSATASGAATPTRIINGAATGLALPSGIGVDSSGLIYVPQQPGGQGLVLTAISVFAANADGNVAPVRTITGTATTLSYPGGPAFDSSNNIYVTNTVNAVGGPPDAVVEFSSTASGNVAPIKTIAGSATAIKSICGIALDSSGNIYVCSSTPDGLGGYAGSILVFSATANGNVAPIRTIAGSSTMMNSVGSVRADSAGNIFVTSYAIGKLNPPPTILKFAPNANGNVAPVDALTSAAFTQPISDITIH